MNPINVFGIFGSSYCGSTLLNTMLNAHSQIYGGGELHWLLTEGRPVSDYAAKCELCGDSCPYWTKDAIQGVSKDHFYEDISDIFRKRFIVDTSKGTEWFRYIFANGRNSDVIFHPLYLVKHPMRVAASFYINTSERDYSASIRHHRLVKKLRVLAPTNLLRRYVEKKYKIEVARRAMKLILAITDDTMNCIKNDFSAEPLVVKYEAIVSRKEEAIGEILNRAGLEFEERIERCFDEKHHFIGGNTSVIYQFTNKWRGHERRSDLENLRQRTYKEKRKTIFLDNKYEKVFTAQEQETIRRLPEYLEACRKLGYHADPGLL